MALAAVQTAMNLEGKNVHPFFTKPSNGHAPEPLPTANGLPIDDTHHDAAYSETDPKSANGQQKRARKTDAVKGRHAASHSKNQASLDRFTLPPAIQSTNDTNVHDTNTPVEASLEVDPNLDRRKRQKTASPEPVFNMLNSAQPDPGAFNWHQQLQAEEEVMRSNGVQGTPRSAIDAPLNILPKQVDQPDQAVEPNTLPVTDMDIAANSNDSAASEPLKTTPKKQIRITKSGRLVSSPPKPTFEASPKKKRGRPRKEAKIIPTITVIRYGTDAASRSALGQKIEDILNAKKKLVARPATQKKAPSKPAGPTHPFFLGKASKEAPPVKVVTELPPVTPRKSACTPGKLRAEFRRDQSPEDPQAFNRGLQSNRAGKQSGLNEASWPTSENAHVRNLDSTSLRVPNATSTQLPLRPRKLKNAVVTLPEHENVVGRLAQNLKSHNGSKARSHSEFEPPEDVRLPKRLLTTGAEIQRRVREQLLVRLSSSGIPQDARQKSHPAVRDLFQGIESTLTPFDEGRCESQPWTLKYCPKYASHVLQTGTEAVVLKDWLQSLTVMAVSGASKVATTIDGKQPPRKKRKKALDDFIVPDGEGDEEEDMVMLPVAEGAGLPSRSFRQPQWIRNNNVVLISGPHGCGKSAAVHAVAKELGFEVFEIHAGMRRSGKDIQDKVGDMTANHLVNHKRSAASVQENVQAADDANDNRVDTVLEDDISSGRQATMASFFQVKPGTGAVKPKVKAKVLEVHKAPVPSAQATLPMAQASHTSQKQSLILIEEADILFEEDQQFWAQITKIASLSKRPIVITCNDERQIPMQDLPIAAILRLQPAPVELATDYLLVLAGREGHILERQAVKELYESKDYDLRASIMELDFWCQMSVGDRKGGLEWMYQRWPPGKDTNEHGQTLRVASEGTYKSGMGWLSHNVLETQGNPVFDKEEELLQEVWADWGISPSAWGIPEASGTRSSREPSTEWFDQLGDLISLDNYADSLSAADMFCRVGLPTYDPSSNQPTDSTQPAITEKSRLSYTLAAPLLQVDHSSDFLNLDTAFSTQTHLAIQRTYPDLSHSHSLSSTPNLRTESDYARAILHHRKILNTKTTLTRPDFALALDPLADPPDQLLPERSSFIFIPSSFDRTFSIITLDLAPYVRSIVAHELILEEQRVRMSSVLNTAGGIGGKRGRTTRAGRVALEGGIRETKRKEKWFDADVDFDAVMRTAGREWAGMGWRCDGWNEEGSASYMGTRDGTASLAGTQDGDVIMQGLKSNMDI